MVKKWTVLIYANGNNELEPEMHKLLQCITKQDINEELVSIVQMGRIEQELVKIIRPKEVLGEQGDSWTGVKRFVISNDIHKEFPLGEKNMADPTVLLEFLQWGTTNYPAERYLLYLGGHCFEYLGALTDYSCKIPYIMGIPQMAKALNQIKKEIDILVLDTCYMNMIEILYELVKNKNNSIKRVLTFIEYGPITGLPIEQLLNILMANAHLETDIILNNIINNLNYDLVAFRLAKKPLEKAKRLANQIAEYLLRSGQFRALGIDEILGKEDLPDPLGNYVKNLQKTKDSLVISGKRVHNSQSPLLGIASKKTDNKLALYYMNLSFTHNNKWPQLLGNIFKIPSAKTKVKLEPTVLPLQGLVTLINIMNLGSTKEEIDKIVQNLVMYKKWQNITNYKFK